MMPRTRSGAILGRQAVKQGQTGRSSELDQAARPIASRLAIFVELAFVFLPCYWLTRSSRLPRPASPASTSNVETVHPLVARTTHGYGGRPALARACPAAEKRTCAVLKQRPTSGRRGCLQDSRCRAARATCLRSANRVAGRGRPRRHPPRPASRHARSTTPAALPPLAPLGRGHRALGLALHGALEQRLALVVVLLASREAELDLRLPVLEVQLQRDQRQAGLLRLADQLLDLRPVQQQLAQPPAARGCSRCPGCTRGCARCTSTARRRGSGRSRRPGRRGPPAATSPRCRSARCRPPRCPR